MARRKKFDKREAAARDDYMVAVVAWMPTPQADTAFDAWLELKVFKGTT